eukprot:evm.model.scf_1407.4 EVM.evm.TU.scf_1407.4   scf_1407:29141-35620(+)
MGPSDLRIAGTSWGKAHSWGPAAFVRASVKPSETAESQRIQVSEAELPNSRVQLTVTVPPAQCKKSFDSVVKVLQQKVKVPGFRKGSPVPLAVLINAVGGLKALHAEVIKDLVEKTSQEALDTVRLPAISDSDRFESDAAALAEGFSVEKPLVYVISLDVFSPLTWKSPFRDVVVKVHMAGDDSTAKVSVDKVLKELQKSKSRQRVVADRGLKKGDVAVLDMDFIRLDRQESMPGAKKEKVAFDTDEPDSLGLVKGMEGMKIAEDRELVVTFPEKWEPPAYRGVEAKAVLHMRELFEWDLEELTVEMVKDVIPEAKSIEDARERMLKAQKAMNIRRTEEEVEQELMRQLAKIAETSVSETAINETGRLRYQDMLMDYQAEGKIDMDTLKQLSKPEMLQNYIRTHREELVETQVAVAAMDAVVEELGLQVSDEDLETEVSTVKGQFEEMGQEYDEDRLREVASQILRNKLVIKWFTDNGNIVILPPRS